MKKKYDTEQVETKKYVVSRYLNYDMVYERFMEAQCNKLQKIDL